MSNVLLKKTTYLVLFCFTILLVGDAYPLHAATEQEGAALIEKGETEYGDGLYREALDSFNRALGVMKKIKNKKRLYLDLALVHYALGDESMSQKALRVLLELDPEITIDANEFPKGFLQLLDKVIDQVQGEMAEQERLEEQKRIEELEKASALKQAEEEKKRQEEIRRKEELKRLDEIRKVEEQRKLDELERAEALRKGEEEKNRQEELKKLEALRKQAELAKAEILKKAEAEKKQQEEARILEEQKKQEELRQAEEKIKLEEQRKAEEIRKAEDQKKQDEQKKIEQLKKATEMLKLANEKKAEEQPQVIIEQSKKEVPPGEKKKKRFPWLIAGLGAVVVVGLLVLLGKKKNEFPSENNSLIVISPDGGESLQVGTKYNITWSSYGSIANVKIEYSSNNGSAWTVVTGSTSNNGSYAWTVPNTPSTSCLVRISDAADAAINDSSNAVFSITTTGPAASITVISPNGGESWQVGTGHTITWTSTGSIVNVKIEYSTNNGTAWSVITGSTTNNGSYSWTIPNAPSNSCLVRISDTSNTGVNDSSNSVFSISTTPPSASVTVASPNGGESWQVLTVHSITWSSTGSIASVKIEYSANSGSSWNTISASEANTGNFVWTVPNTPSTSCLVRISDASNASINDNSNGIFSITSTPPTASITVTSPNGGESWQVASNHSITWTSGGSIANVSIEYSTNNGSSWNFLTASTSNGGSYMWTVPNTPSTSCLVRISDASNASVNDSSDSTFSIVNAGGGISINSVSPSSITVIPGTSGNINIDIARTGGYTGNISLQVISSLPSGASASYVNPNSGNSGQIVISVGTSCELVTDFLVQFRASGSGVSSASSSFLFTIKYPTGFSLDSSPSSLTLNPGSSGTINVTIARIGGYTGSVSILVISSLPAGVTATFVNPGTGNSGQINISVGTSCALVSNYSVSFRAQGSGVSSVSSSFLLTIQH